MMFFNEIELVSKPGTYVLILRAAQPRPLTIGRLGTFDFPAGWYVYVGSAHGAGGLRARVGRHLRSEKPLHWHIDYLTAAAPVVAIWWRVSPERLECVWAQQLAAWGTVPVPRFGASDCRCPAHLFALPDEALLPAQAALAPLQVMSLFGGDAEGDGFAEH